MNKTYSTKIKIAFWILILIVILIYVIEWFVSSVYLRIIAGVCLNVAIIILPVIQLRKANKQGQDQSGESGDGSIDQSE